jgi:hypothetical protein
LFVAAENGFFVIERLLVADLGADVNLAYHAGVTALMIAAERGHLAVVQCLVADLGADINQVHNFGATALTGAAQRGHLGVVRYLVELGAEVGLADKNGYPALLLSADSGQYSTMQFLLEHASANIEGATNDGRTFWDLMFIQVEEYSEYEEKTAALIALLRVLVLRGALPPALVALLLLEPTSATARVLQEGARLRARLPAYLKRRRALLDAHCPVLLTPLRVLVHGYMELTSTEEIWATGLGTAP